MEKMLNLVLFGPPGAGKGTQSENLINKYGLVHLSTGDILRTEIARGTDLGNKAKAVMDRGELVSDDIVIAMIESKLDANTNAKGFIFDGFPRTANQAEALDDLLQKKGTGISAMIALEVDDEELIKRLLIRGQASGRADDKDEEVIRRRIVEYNNKTLPLKKYYNQIGKFHSINGIGSVDQIFKLLVERIVFLNAEMELTALETDLEHLDLTIQDFDVADDIAPELLLEIDAVKRAEAEEESDAKVLKSKNKKAINLSKKTSTKPIQTNKKKIVAKPKKSLKKVVTVSRVKGKSISPKKPATKTKKIIKKTLTKSKLVPKKVVKKTKLFKASISKTKKVVKKTATKSKTVLKKVIKKLIPKKKLAPKKVIKNAKTKKVVKKITAKKPIKKTASKKKK